jgi:hypothetical protein
LCRNRGRCDSAPEAYAGKRFMSGLMSPPQAPLFDESTPISKISFSKGPDGIKVAKKAQPSPKYLVDRKVFSRTTNNSKTAGEISLQARPRPIGIHEWSKDEDNWVLNSVLEAKGDKYCVMGSKTFWMEKSKMWPKEFRPIGKWSLKDRHLILRKAKAAKEEKDAMKAPEKAAAKRSQGNNHDDAMALDSGTTQC